MSYSCNTLSITWPAVLDLVDYLLAHESDIYYEINDFGSLSHVFHVVIERQPTDSASGEPK